MPPTAATLREAALAHLARFAATEAGLAAVLGRRIDRWARRAEGEGQDKDAIAAHCAQARVAIPGIVAAMVALGAVDDAAFARARARSLARAGRSRRAIGAHLANRGVSADLAGAALPDEAAHELAAALIHARKRRLGAWRTVAPRPDQRRRDLASLARAGFGHAVAARALEMGVAEAEALIVAFRAAL